MHLVACLLAAGPVAAGPITIANALFHVDGSSNDELPVHGIGNWARLTTGGGLNHVATVGADQTTLRQQVVGFWPVMEFNSPADYEANKAAVVSVPETKVTMYAEVWAGGATGPSSSSPGTFQSIHFDAFVSGAFSPDGAKNEVNWRFTDPELTATLDEAVVTFHYEPVKMPPGIPQIIFADGSPSLGVGLMPYYPTVLELVVSVERRQDDPPVDDTPDGPQTPEPATVLLAVFAAGGWAVRRFIRRPKSAVADY
jgi:hypothetical protein